MVDWPGLLKWTLSHSDGTASKEIKPMDEETKKWLEEALESYTINEAKRMTEIIQEVIKPETAGNKNEEENRVALLDELSDLVEGLETARDLVRMGVYGAMVHHMFNSVHPEVRKSLYYIFASCNSNNTFVQMTSMELGAFKLVNSVVQEVNTVNKEAAFAALSSLIRGECLVIKRNFIDIEGVEFLLELLTNEQACSSNKIKTKAVTLLNDLVFYDDKLDYPDMVTYNKGGPGQEKKVNDKSTQHISLEGNNNQNEEHKVSDQKDQGALDISYYKHFVKRKLIEKGFIQIGLRYVKKENPKSLFDLRTAYFSTVISLIQFDSHCKPPKEYFDYVMDFADYLLKESKQQEDFFDSELSLLKTLVSLNK